MAAGSIANPRRDVNENSLRIEISGGTGDHGIYGKELAQDHERQDIRFNVKALIWFGHILKL
jgi:hypothetical protein